MKARIISEINREIYRVLDENETLRQDAKLREMTLYALGMDPNGALLSGGKRLRPLFCCLICGMLSGSHQPALGYGAGLEMFHNFTLVHDDIEDNGDVRHNRPALWKRDGLALALNQGDLLFELALQTVMDNDRALNNHRGLELAMAMAAKLFLGQHRDISFEGRHDISEAEYFRMVEGKTGVLLGLSFALGALSAGADESVITGLERAGFLLGLAFQVRDDYLGTWGDSEILGKSVSGDILEKKNTLAVVYTAAKDETFLNRWKQYDGNPHEAVWFAERMTLAGAPDYLDKKCKEYMEQTMAVLLPFRKENHYMELLDGILSALASRNK